jgi:hypothetical protein
MSNCVDFNEISPSKLLRNIKVKEKFCVVLVHKSALILSYYYVLTMD